MKLINKAVTGFIFSSVFFLSICIGNNGDTTSRKHTTIDIKCRALNDSATRIMKQALNSNFNIKVLDTVIVLLNQAIKCDSNYFTATFNKAKAYALMSKYPEAISLANRLLVLSHNDPGVIEYKGLLYEKILRTDSARMQYKLADKTFAKKIKMYPDSVRIMGEYLILIALMDIPEHVDPLNGV